MVNMNVHLTLLVKDKLDGPYWEFIGSKRQHTHLFRSFLYLMWPFAEGMCSWKYVCNVNTFVPLVSVLVVDMYSYRNFVCLPFL
jgi:hypothetical protein